MRILLATLLYAGTAFGQGAGNVQFRDWNVPAVTGKPKVSCGSLRALTNYELSVTAATVIRPVLGFGVSFRVSEPSQMGTRFSSPT